MIAAFIKKTFPVDVVRPLEVYVGDTFGKKEKQKLTPYLNEIQQLRDACRVNEQTVAPSTAIPKHIQYYKTLLKLENKMSFGRSGRGIFTKAKNVEILFKWTDSFRPTKIEQSYDIKLEKFSILFNIGALQSLHAVKLSEQGQDGEKEALKLFRLSAGVFEYLSNQEVQGFPFNLDIQKDSCKFLSILMLAQAQSLFFNAVAKQKTKEPSPSLLAKLALGAAKYFDQADSLITSSPSFQQWLSKSSYSFSSHCKFQSKLLKGYANFYEAQNVAKSSSMNTYGAEIARLQQANTILNSMGKLSKTVVPSLEEQRKALAAKLAPRLKECVRDNNDIYHEPIPKLGDLKPIEMKQNMKITPFECEDDLEDRFTNLVPKEIVGKEEELRLKFSEDFRNRIKKECDETTDAARAILASLGLPASIDSMNNDNGIPDSVWERIQKVQESGGYAELEKLYGRVLEGSADSYALLNKDIIDKLDTESKVDNEIRNILGQEWGRTSSNELQAEYRAGVSTIRGHLDVAAKSNEKVENKMSSNMNQIRDLNRSREDIASTLPEVSNEQKENPATKELKNLLDQLSECISERDTLINKYETESKEMNIKDILMKDSTKKIDNIEAVVKKPLDEIEEKLKGTYASQEALLAQINTANEEFEKNRDTNPQILARTAKIHELNQACEEFQTCNKTLLEGIKFYTDLMTDYLAPLKNETENYCVAREQERDILLGDLGTNIAKIGLADIAMGGSNKPNNNNGGAVPKGNNNNNNNNNDVLYSEEKGDPDINMGGPNAPPEDPNSSAYNPAAMGGQPPPHAQQGYPPYNYQQPPPQYGYPYGYPPYGQAPPYYGQAPPQGGYAPHGYPPQGAPPYGAPPQGPYGQYPPQQGGQAPPQQQQGQAPPQGQPRNPYY